MKMSQYWGKMEEKTVRITQDKKKKRDINSYLLCYLSYHKINLFSSLVIAPE